MPNEQYNRKTVPAVCEQCGQPFKTRPYQIKRGDGRFCSPSCATAWNVANGPSRKRLPDFGPDRRRCWKCKAVKEKHEFSPKVFEGRSPICRDCATKRTVAWSRKNRERSRATNRRSAAKRAAERRPSAQARRDELARLKAAQPPPTEKTCTKCGESKPMDAYGKNSRSRYGRLPVCRACDATRLTATCRRWRQRHPEQVKEIRKANYRKSRPGQAKLLEQIKAEKIAKADKTEKACKKCGFVKPITDFYAGQNTADGRMYQCATCVAERSRKRYQAHPEKESERVRRWQQRNVASVRHNGHVRRVREREVPGSHTLAEWKALCKRFDNRCVRCGEVGKLTIDHIIPLTKPGASDSIGALQPLCLKCNSAKGNRESIDYRMTPFTKTGQRLL